MELRTILIRSPRNSWDAAFLLVCADRDNDLNWIGYAMFRFHKHATRTHETQTIGPIFLRHSPTTKINFEKSPITPRRRVSDNSWNDPCETLKSLNYPPNIRNLLLMIYEEIWHTIKFMNFFLVILLFNSLLDVTVVIFKLLRLLGMHRYFIIIHCWFSLWSHLH